MPSPKWQLTIRAPRSDLDAAIHLLADHPVEESLYVSLFNEGDGMGCAELFFAEKPDPAHVLTCANLNAGDVEIKLTPFSMDGWRELTPTDRVEAEAGRFRIFDPASQTPLGDEEIAIIVNRSEAFGVGEHVSTRACLEVIDRLALEGFSPTRVLDVGCGSGILSIAAAKAWPAALVTAIDNEARAVEVASDHARLNGVGENIEILHQNGVAAPALQERRPFDLILMNVLAPPLIRFAPDIPRLAAADSFIVLAGFFAEQRDAVLGAYETAGLSLRAELESDGWVCLVLTNPTA